MRATSTAPINAVDNGGLPNPEEDTEPRTSRRHRQRQHQSHHRSSDHHHRSHRDRRSHRRRRRSYSSSFESSSSSSDDEDDGTFDSVSSSEEDSHDRHRSHRRHRHRSRGDYRHRRSPERRRHRRRRPASDESIAAREATPPSPPPPSLTHGALAKRITRVQSVFRGHRERTESGIAWLRSVTKLPFATPAEALLVHRAALTLTFEAIVEELLSESIVPELLAEVITEDLDLDAGGGARGGDDAGSRLLEPAPLRSVLVLPEMEMLAARVYEDIERAVVRELARETVQRHVDGFVEDYLRRSRLKHEVALAAKGARRVRVAGAVSVDPLDAATMALVDEMALEEVHHVVRETVRELVAEHIVQEHFDVWLRAELAPIVADVAAEAIEDEVMESEAVTVLRTLVEDGVRRCAVDTVAELSEARERAEAEAIMQQAGVIARSLALERLSVCFATKGEAVMLRRQSTELFHSIVADRLAAKLALQTTTQRALTSNVLLRDVHRRIMEDACFDALLGCVERDLLRHGDTRTVGEAAMNQTNV